MYSRSSSKTRSVSFNEVEFYFITKKIQPSVSNIPSNRYHDTVVEVVGGEVSFNEKKEPSQIKLPSSVQEPLVDPQWKEAMKTES